jgi:hypothetical protein
MHRRDVAALNKSLTAYRKLSPRAHAEASCLQLQHGWKFAALHATRKCQAIALGLPDTSLTPSELKTTKFDQFRWLSATVARSLLRLGLSKFEPHPPRAIEAEEQRRKALGVAERPSHDAG